MYALMLALTRFGKTSQNGIESKAALGGEKEKMHTHTHTHTHTADSRSKCK
jgi:hypothetical protein